MKRALIIIFAILGFEASSQNFTPLESSEKIPDHFLIKASDRKSERKEEATDSRKTKKVKDQFYAESSFSSDFLFKSGYVLFNDPITLYIEKVAAEIFRANPELKNSFRFYTLKSSAVNAISTSDSVIFINIGLMAQLASEAQLAFIICHELIHCIRQDVLENYVHIEQINRGKGIYEDLSIDERELEQCRYSQETEISADKEALKLYSKTRYSLNEIDGVFDIIQHSYLPADNVPFNFSLLESDRFQFPKNYKLETVNPIIAPDDAGNKGTYPGIKSRRVELQAELKLIGNENKVEFISGKESFEQVRTLARYETLHLKILNRNYESAIYLASLLLNQNPNDYYLKESMGRALFGLANYSGTRDFSKVHLYPNETQGYLHQVAYLFNKLNENPSEIPIVALHYFLKLKVQYPGKKHLEYYLRKIANLLLTKHKLTLDFFYERGSSEDTVSHYSSQALTEYMANPFLKELFQDKDSSKISANEISPEEEKAIRRRGHALHIDTIIHFEPVYALIDERKREAYRYLKSEKGQENLSDRITKIAEDIGLQISMLETRELDEDDIEQYNDFSFLNEYISEKLRHPEGMNFSAIEREQLLQLTEKYGTPYVNLMALIYVRKSRKLLWPIAYSVLFPVVLPLTLPKIISSGKNCYYLNLLYNIETDELVFSSSANILSADRTDLLSAHIYYTLNQIKSERK